MALSMTVQMYSVSIIAILSAPLYMLVMAKVHKRGAVIGICALVGILWALFGGFFVLIWMIALGIVGEILASKAQYQNYKTLTVSFGLYTVAYYPWARLPRFTTIRPMLYGALNGPTFTGWLKTRANHIVYSVDFVLTFVNEQHDEWIPSLHRSTAVRLRYRASHIFTISSSICAVV